NQLTVHLNGESTSITLTNSARHGPIFSGPQEEPFCCQTKASGLGEPNNQHYCSAPTRVRYVYLSSSSHKFMPFDPNRPWPDDLAHTTTTTGHEVPFIVRVETGTINRAIYNIAILDNPNQPGPNPWTRDPGWNGRLVYWFQ